MSSLRAPRLLAVALTAGLLVLACSAGARAAVPSGAAPVAAAADEDADGTDSPFGFELTDSRGISVWDMDLALDHGDAWNPGDVDKRMWGSVMDAAWASYRIVTAVEIWILDWALTLDWMDWVLGPMRGLADLVGSFMDQLGLMPLMLIVLALVGSWWLLRGRYAGGVVELLIGCVIASFALGALSDPMETIAGDNGMLMQGRDAGIELAAAVASGDVDGQTDVGEYRTSLMTALVDTMVRTPHQVINYGQVIDGTGCEETYDDAVAGDDARDQISGCDEQLGDYADRPDAMKAMTALSVLPTAYFLFLFSALLVALVLVTVLGAAWTAVRLVPQLVMGVVPGPSRAGLFRSLAMTVFAMFMLTCSIVFVVVWMQFLQLFFGSSAGLPWIVRVYLVDVLLVVGGIVIWIFRSKAKTAFKNVADRLAQLGASSTAQTPSSMPRLPRMRTPRLPSRGTSAPPAALPRPSPTPVLGTAADAGGAVRTAASVVGAGASITSARGVRQLVGAGSRAALPPSPSGGLGGGRPGLPRPGGTGPKAVGAAARLRGRLAQGATLAIQAGATLATSGGSTAATAGARALTAGGAKAAAAAATSTATSTAAGAAARAAGSSGARAVTAGTSSKSVAGAAARAAARTARSGQVRARLRSVQMRQDGDRMIDEQTGRSYTVLPARTPGMQILQPSGESRRRRGGAA